MAHSYRKSTIKISFSNEYARPKAHEIERFIREEVKIDSQELIGIHLSIVSSVVYLKLINDAVCDRIIRATKNGLKFRHSDGHISDVTIDHAGLGLRTIRVFELPFEVPSDLVIAALQPYGRVLSHVAEKWSNFTTYPVLNGVRQIRIELTKHVPSYLIIGGCRAIVIYDGQPKTCSGCGKEGHVRSECIQRRIVQVPTGEAVPSSTPTSLPLTYVDVLRTDADPTYELPPAHDRVQDSPAADTEMTSTSPPPNAPQTPMAEVGNSGGEMEIDTAVVPTSALVPERRGSLPNSDSEAHTRKQKSTKRHKKRRHSPSDGCQMPSTGDSDAHSTDAEHPAAHVESLSPSQQYDVDHPLQERNAESSVGDTTADHLSSSVAETLTPSGTAGGSRRETGVFHGNWADDHEDDPPADAAVVTAAATCLGS